MLAEVSLELTAEARRLADRRGTTVEALLFGGFDDIVSTLGRHGANAVQRIDAEGLDSEDPARAAAVLERLIRGGRAHVVLFGATRLGSDFAGPVAARLDVGLLARCSRLDLGPDGRLQGERPVYRGRATATAACVGASPALATVIPGALSANRRPSDQSPVVRDVALPADLRICAPPVRLESSWRVSPWEMDLEEAETIVAGGLGLATRADFQMLAELAGALGGAVGASRPVVDAGVVPYHRQVGISGRIVRPRLYIACAISGSVHHVSGMKGSGTIIAINRDPHAPIFQLADLAVVGDAREIVQALLGTLRGSEGSNGRGAREHVIGALAASMRGAPA